MSPKLNLSFKGQVTPEHRAWNVHCTENVLPLRSVGANTMLAPGAQIANAVRLQAQDGNISALPGDLVLCVF